MIFRRVADLVAGRDAVRPFDDRLWHVAQIAKPSAERWVLIISHPTDGAHEIEVCPNDRVRLA